MMMFRPFAALLAVFSMLTAGTAAYAEPISGGAVLTIAGDVGKTNRGALDPFHDGFLKHHEKTFEAAYEFDAAALDALPQKAITAEAEGWPAPLKLEGPLLADVLAAAGAGGKPVTVFALDGYGAEMSPEQIASREWVLATKADGQPLGIGGRGPLWLAYDTGDEKATADEEAPWVWSAFYIEVGK